MHLTPPRNAARVRQSSLLNTKNLSIRSMPRLLLPLFILAALMVFVPFAHLVPVAMAGGTVTGTVFQDYNANGTRDTTGSLTNDGGGAVAVAADRGIAGVTITAYDSGGVASGATTSASNGSYTLTLTRTGPYRIEFTGLPASFEQGPYGTNDGSSVRFVPDGGAVGIDLGVNIPADFCQNNPDLVTSCYVYGSQSGPQPDPFNVGATIDFSNNPVILSFPYSAGSNANVVANWDLPTAHALNVPARLVGPTWGLAYGRTPRRIFASAFMKKHSAYGPGGPGAIYRVNRATGALEATYTVPGATTDAHDPNPNNYVTDNFDVAWDAVGKTSLGGIDINDDDTRLYAMNLENRSLYMLDANTGAVLGSQAIPTAGIPLVAPSPVATCVPSDVRPFAVEYYRDKVYIGVVCSAESTVIDPVPDDTFTDGSNGCLANAAYDFAYTDVGAGITCLGEAFVDADGNGIYNVGDTRQLQALIYQVDPVSLAITPTPVLQIPLNYPRNFSVAEPNINFQAPGRWRVWANAFRGVPSPPNPNSTTPTEPQPVLTDLEFDSRGVMLIALRDRYGEQAGNGVYSNPASPAAQYSGSTAGDLLLACGTGATWVLESNAACGGGPPTLGAGTSEGPGGGEFFFRDEYAPYHSEVMVGGVVQIPGFPDVVANSLDPFPGPGEVFDSGFRWLNNSNGTLSKGYRLFNGDFGDIRTFGKAGGLGDVIALCDAAPVEIGNRVWYDADRNGVQDPNEPPLANVTVELFDPATNAVIGTAVTDAIGTYYFSSATNTSTASARYGLPVRFGGTYQVRINTSQSAITTPGYILTVSNTGGGSIPDLNDSDGIQVGSFAVHTFSIGQPGQNNHSYDFGFSLPPTAITLASFTAVRQGSGVAVQWETSAELNTWGFHILRSTTGSRADAQQVTSEIIPAQGRGQGGAIYRWFDTTADPQAAYSYWLVEVELSGAKSEHGPVAIGPLLSAVPYLRYLPLISR